MVSSAWQSCQHCYADSTETPSRNVPCQATGRGYAVSRTERMAAEVRAPTANHWVLLISAIAGRSCTARGRAGRGSPPGRRLCPPAPTACVAPLSLCAAAASRARFLARAAAVISRSASTAVFGISPAATGSRRDRCWKCRFIHEGLDRGFRRRRPGYVLSAHADDWRPRGVDEFRPVCFAEVGCLPQPLYFATTALGQAHNNTKLDSNQSFKSKAAGGRPV